MNSLSEMMPQRASAARSARVWLNNFKALDDTEINQKKLALDFCTAIIEGENTELTEWTTSRRAYTSEPPENFIKLSSTDLKNNIIKILSSSPSVQSPAPPLGIKIEWQSYLGALSVAYARKYDLVSLSDILRLTGVLDLHSRPITWSEKFILDQQLPTGAFGLLLRECNVSKTQSKYNNILLKVTMNALMAIATKYMQNQRESLHIADIVY